MVEHIIGAKHRTNYLALTLGPSLCDLTKEGLADQARAVEKEEGRKIDMIKTVISDARLDIRFVPILYWVGKFYKTKV